MVHKIENRNKQNKCCQQRLKKVLIRLSYIKTNKFVKVIHKFFGKWFIIFKGIWDEIT